MVFKSSYTKDDTDKISEFVTKHGDGVKDVCFRVSDTKKAYDYLKNKKAKFVSQLKVYEDQFGKVSMFTI